MNAFRERGLRIACVIPEPVEDLRNFAARWNVSFPLLSDPDSAIVRRFGVVDRNFIATGNLVGKDIPYAVSFLVDAQGIIQAKFFEKDPVNRRTGASMLVVQGGTGTGGGTVQADHFTLKTSVSNAAVAPGQRLTLALDFELRPSHHAYAPGARGYRPLDLRLDSDNLFEIHDTRFPQARDYFFAPLRETVPVFEGRFRVLKDVTLSMRPALSLLKDDPQPSVAVKGFLDYQVCSTSVCYPPASIPLQWSLKIQPWAR